MLPDGARNARGQAPSIRRAVIVALQVAIIGSALLALVESLSAAVLTAKHFEGDRWPLRIIVGAIGRGAVTHAMFWTPALAVVALVANIVPYARRRIPPLPLALGAFLLGTAMIIVPADFHLATKLSQAVIYLISAGLGATCLVATYFVHRMALRSDGRFLNPILRIGTVSALVVIGGSAVVFVNSPLFNPAGFKVGTAASEGAIHERPHVLWIVMDTVRADRLGCYGYSKKTSPFVDSWAEQSIVFDKTIGNGMWTVPSHSSMFTGASVRRHGMGGNDRALDDRFETVAEVLSGNGYATACFSNNPWISRNTNIVQGFDLAHVMYHLRHLSRFSWEIVLEHWGITPFVPWLDRDFGGALTNYMISQWLDGFAGGTAPVFLFVNYMEAHLPYTVPQRFQRMVMSEDQVHRSYELRERAYGPVVQLLDKDFALGGSSRIAPADKEIYKLQYESGIRYVDERVRELIGMFDERGMLDNTLIVLVSDHGEHLDTHGMWAHQYLTYNDITHVMMMIREPGRKRPLRVDTPVQPSDLYSTVLHQTLGSAARSTAWESRDLFEVARRGGEPRVVVTECVGPGQKLRKKISSITDPRLRHLSTPQIAAQDGRFKYMASGDGARELYDLAADPGELHNVIGRWPEEAHRLAAYIKDWQAAIPLFVPTEEDTQADMDPAFLEALKSLGYLGD